MIKCGSCKVKTAKVELVKACYAKQVFSCDWLMNRGYDEDGGQVIEPCGRHAWATAHGFECEAGHADDNRLIYLDDEEIRGGHPATLLPEAREMDGHVLVG